MAAPKLTTAPKDDPLAGSRLTLVEDPLEMRRLLQKAIDAGSKAWFQIKGDSIRHETRLLDSSSPERGALLQLPSDLDVAEFEARLLELGAKSCLILMFLPGAALVGSAPEYLGRAGATLRFAYPTRVFKIQRRREARLDIHAGYDLTIDIRNVQTGPSRLEKKIIDISASGLSFRVYSPREAALFTEGLSLRGCLVMLEGREVRLDLIVRNAIDIGSSQLGPSIKIGCSVASASRGGADIIAAYVAARLSHRVI